MCAASRRARRTALIRCSPASAKRGRRIRCPCWLLFKGSLPASSSRFSTVSAAADGRFPSGELQLSSSQAASPCVLRGLLRNNPASSERPAQRGMRDAWGSVAVGRQTPFQARRHIRRPALAGAIRRRFSARKLRVQYRSSMLPIWGQLPHPDLFLRQSRMRARRRSAASALHERDLVDADSPEKSGEFRQRFLLSAPRPSRVAPRHRNR